MKVWEDLDQELILKQCLQVSKSIVQRFIGKINLDGLSQKLQLSLLIIKFSVYRSLRIMFVFLFELFVICELFEFFRKFCIKGIFVVWEIGMLDFLNVQGLLCLKFGELLIQNVISLMLLFF